MTENLTIAEIMAAYAPGSGLSWSDEFRKLLTDEKLAMAPRMREMLKNQGPDCDYLSTTDPHPIVLGNDSRVWDGHHRILLALILGGINCELPVEVTEG